MHLDVEETQATYMCAQTEQRDRAFDGFDEKHMVSWLNQIFNAYSLLEIQKRAIFVQTNFFPMCMCDFFLFGGTGTTKRIHQMNNMFGCLKRKHTKK